jgi:hypothetical protein
VITAFRSFRVARSYRRSEELGGFSKLGFPRKTVTRSMTLGLKLEA